MKTTLFTLVIIVALASGTFGATCVGAFPCKACKNCHYCGHCAKRGGKCGICADHNPKKVSAKVDTSNIGVFAKR